MCLVETKLREKKNKKFRALKLLIAANTINVQMHKLRVKFILKCFCAV